MMKTKGILAWLAVEAALVVVSARVVEAADCVDWLTWAAEPVAAAALLYPPPKCSLASLSIKLVISYLIRARRGRIISCPEMHQSASL